MKIRFRPFCLASKPPRAGRRVAGFTLLEVLVSIVVLSFGVLGVVGLQTAALKANKQARFQSSGVRLARELSDMMRGNKDVATSTGTANPYLQSLAAGAGGPGFTTDCTVAACGTPALMATYQISDWVARVQGELPGAQIVVCFDSVVSTQWACDNISTALQVVIKIGWSQDAFNAASGVQTAAGSNPLVVIPVIPGNPNT